MSNYRVVVHAGYPKSASTALQDTFAHAAGVLKSKGVLYPEALRSQGTTKHEELFRLIRLNKVNKALKILKEEVDRSDNIHTIFLSTESIVNQLYNIDSSRWVQLFQGLNQLGSLEILVIHRDAEGFLRSYYKQAIINQPSELMECYSTDLSFEKFSKLPEIHRMLDLHGIVNNIRRVSGAPVKVFGYGPRVVDEVLKWVAEDGFSIEEKSLSNVSLSSEVVEIIRQLNSIKPSPSQRNAWFRLISRCSTLGSQTALALASRSDDAEMYKLEADWLLKIQPGQNPTLGVDDEKMLSLVNKVYWWLCRYKDINVDGRQSQDENRASLKLKPDGRPEVKFCVNKKLDLILSVSTHKNHGESLFIGKKLELSPFEAVLFSDWSDWEQDPLHNRSWQWRLNWLSFLPYLLAYHRSSRDDAVLSFAREAIQSWLDTYLETDASYPFEFIWHDHATALRAEQLVLFSYYCCQHSPEWAEQHVEFLEYVQRALVIHGEWLAKDSFYSEHTNHGLEQARVLLLLGTVFEGELAREWQQVAIRRISSELEFAFTSEGVHVENSPAYHVFVFKVFLGIIKDYPTEVLGDLAEQFDQFSAKALNFVTHILRPDGKLPPIGDTEQLPTSDAYREMFGDTPEYQYFLYALTQGKQGVVPPVLNRVYPRSGYAIFRDQWPAKENYGNAFHLIAKVGCSSRYHHQQDEGHISLYAGGEDWLIDSGLYNYINKDPVRKYMRSRPGHNVPMISHASYDKEFKHRLSAWCVTDYDAAVPTPYVCMEIGVLHPVVHNRRVDFDAPTKLVKVEDQFDTEDRELRNITLQWHFPKDKTITIEGNQVKVTSSTGNRLHIEFEGGVPDNLSVAKGIKEDRVFSCISYTANKVEPSQALRVMFKARSGLQVTTHFKFELIDAQKTTVRTC